MGELSQLQGFKENIKLKPREQVIKHIRMEDLEPDFDIDFDTKEEPAAPEK